MMPPAFFSICLMISDVRTTLSIDHDVLEAAKELAALQHRNIGAVVSDLARSGLAAPQPQRRSRNGVPLLPARRARVTSALVRRLQQGSL